MDAPLKKLKIDLRALLQSAGRQGLTLEEVERDYIDLNKYPIPYEQFGASSTYELLMNLKDTIFMLKGDPDSSRPDLYYPISCQSTRHLEGLIDQQRVHAPTRIGGIVPELAGENRNRNGQVLSAISNIQSETTLGGQTNGNFRPMGASVHAPRFPPSAYNLRQRNPAGQTQPGYQPGPAAYSTVATNRSENVAPRPLNATGGLRATLNQRLGINTTQTAVQQPAIRVHHPSTRTQQPQIQMQPPSVQMQQPPIRMQQPTANVQRAGLGEGIVLNDGPEPEERHSLQADRAKLLAAMEKLKMRKQETATPSPESLGERSTPIPTPSPTPTPVPRAMGFATRFAGPSARFPGPPGFKVEGAMALSVQPNQSNIPSQQISPLSTATSPIPSSYPDNSEFDSVSTQGIFPPYRRQRRDSGDSLATAASTALRQVDFPEEAPPLLPTQMPCGVKIPYEFWQTIYSILRENNNKWMDIRQFQSEFARKTKRPLSGEKLQKYGIKSYKQLFVDIPLIDVMHSPDEIMSVRLLPPMFAKKNTTLYDVKPRYKSVRPQTAGGVAIPHEYEDPFMIEDNEETVYIPNAPISDDAVSSKYKDPASAIPQEFRAQVYNLLWNHYRTGVDISTFSEMFTKRYGASLNADRDCGMPLDRALYMMYDLVDVGKAEDGKVWLRPVDYRKVHDLYKEQKRVQRERRLRGAASGRGGNN